jgi:hypothetical protein
MSDADLGLEDAFQRSVLNVQDNASGCASYITEPENGIMGDVWPITAEATERLIWVVATTGWRGQWPPRTIREPASAAAFGLPCIAGAARCLPGGRATTVPQ